MSIWGRFLAFVFYLLFLTGLNWVVHGTLVAPASIEGAWYYAGVGYFLLSLMTAPFFSKPTDTIATALTAGTILLTMGIPAGLPGAATLKIGQLFTVIYCGLAIGSAIVAILTRPRDALHPESPLSKAAFRVSDRLGRGEVVFSFVFLLSTLGSFAARPNVLLLLLLFWLIAVLVRPHEIVANLIQDWQSSQGRDSKQVIGTVRAYENPGVALVVVSEGKRVEPGTPVGIVDGNSGIQVGTAVGDFELQNERWMRVLLNQRSIVNRTAEGTELIPERWLAPRVVFTLDATLLNTIQNSSDIPPLITSAEEPLVGFVAEESGIDQIQIELLPMNADIYEGRLVTTTIKGKQVLYQVLDAVTRLEALENKSSLGYLRARARKIGWWDEEHKRFKSMRWLPEIHTPVYLREDEPVGFRPAGVGYMPGSCFTVRLDPELAVTHNTAILGVLGSGKSYLAFELIARLVEQRIKVICLDITGQYPPELSRYYDLTRDPGDDNMIRTAIAGLANNVSKNVEQGGNWQRFRELVYADIKHFIEDPNRYIRVYNPEGYKVWRQDSRPYQDQASMATLTPVEVTRIISEGVLEAVSGTLSDQARVCIVFEEAHSLIPEWTSISFEGDRHAAMGTAKAVLQGRKYGLGCMVITQRTANVTKSVLNQCNTVFALRTFDATGMEFLANYIGRDYTNVLSTLKERHAVVYGRAISSDSPLIIRLNERPQFLGACQEGNETRDATRDAGDEDGDVGFGPEPPGETEDEIG